MTLAFEDANSKLIDDVSVIDIDAKDCVDDSFVEILKLNFGPKSEALLDRGGLMVKPKSAKNDRERQFISNAGASVVITV